MPSPVSILLTSSPLNDCKQGHKVVVLSNGIKDFSEYWVRTHFLVSFEPYCASFFLLLFSNTGNWSKTRHKDLPLPQYNGFCGCKAPYLCTHSVHFCLKTRKLASLRSTEQNGLDGQLNSLAVLPSVGTATHFGIGMTEVFEKCLVSAIYCYCYLYFHSDWLWTVFNCLFCFVSGIPCFVQCNLCSCLFFIHLVFTFVPLWVCVHWFCVYVCMRMHTHSHMIVWVCVRVCAPARACVHVLCDSY